MVNPNLLMIRVRLGVQGMRGALAALTIVACLAPGAAAAQEPPAEPAPAPEAVVAQAPPAEPAPEAVVSDEAAVSPTGVYDPWEGLNRDLYAVHDAVDRAVLEPVARGYRAVVPEPARNGVRNFLRNLRGPVIFVNDVLQGEPRRAGVTAARFGLNSTIGVLGVLDPATHLGLERHDEDFGQTLAVWGVDEGPYIFVPVLGPTNVRDGIGRVVDIAFDPLTWSEFDDVDTVRVSRTVVGGISTREGVLDAVDGVRETSIDPYVTYRNTYETLRDGQIRNGEPATESLPSFDDYDTLDDTLSSEDNSQQSRAIEPATPSAPLAGERDAPTSAPQTGENP